MPQVALEVSAIISLALACLYFGLCIGIMVSNHEKRIIKSVTKSDEVVMTVINKDALVEWLRQIPLHNLGGGNRVIFEDDFKKAINGLPCGTSVTLRKE